MTRKYNYIYSKLVEDENDVVGVIAYGIYKSEKVKYIEELSKSGNIITETDIDAFNRVSNTHLKLYKDQATAILQNFINNVTQNAIKDIEINQKELMKVAFKELAPDQKKMFEEQAKTLQKPWYVDFGKAVLTSIFVTILLGLYVHFFGKVPF